ncbi:branched-chain amino acid aminotransferase [Neoasaia chiangmaiensis NBRC 101099]|uniref:Probable branched-chain-amino-acid aminotransferase n=1 Tax=Neoasaia chiangmaiensis TaxID=320497 RepID=A0A1U9KS11_9PROT|nr:branched-chain amino acid aminotransferase [Neoasaia chiangmaiensis]AQS88674.1 branched chain amino acid aminotransferase [Neoasaia chiangmaiensis]GBR41085.1 branched-chain amino acid aminotransferase [Neoasaia chiangmaiensis NBRC 101099]GEN13618.1 branched-chain-amino-acid aminotransferase [Neoasaia chiangmaiensis]
MDAEQTATLPTFTIEPTTTPTDAARRAEILANPVFGRAFTDHMAVIRYTEGEGWHDAKVTARQPLTLDPASSVLHYGQEIFEGMKAYRIAGGGVATFRPEANARRFRESAARMAMADLPEALFVEAVDQLVKIDSEWVPSGDGQSLYLRPFMIANEVFLGVKPASEYLFMVIACPVGAYFGKGCVSVWVSEDYTRAAPGGTGAAKCGGNYAGSLVAQAESKKHGCDQVLFLDSREQRFVEEMGGMNVMFVRDDNTLVTPPLTGTILPGITRDSIIRLAIQKGMKVEEAAVDIDELFQGAASGRYKEAFACGTAAVLSPIGTLRRAGGVATFGDGETPGAVSVALKKALTDIQTGRSNDQQNWVHHIL